MRTTIRERRLIAEPFLLVGIIASIKEMLAGVVLILSVAALLLRRKERDPNEELSDDLEAA